MKNIAIIYHDADFDGKLSNEVCHYWLAKQHPEAHIHSYGWDYGRPLPVMEGGQELHEKSGNPRDWDVYDAIYIVDLSVDELMARPELRDKIVWIDHHKSAIEKWDNPQVHSVPFDNVKIDDSLLEAPAPFAGYRIDGVAACRLCWEWFSGWEADKLIDAGLPEKRHFVCRLTNEPRLIRLAGEWDIWDKRDPDAEPLQYGLRALDAVGLRTAAEVAFAGGRDAEILLQAYIADGRTIMSYCQKQADEHAIKHAHDVRFYGLNFCCLNIGGPGNSTLLRAAVKPHHDALMAWRFDGQKAYVSLYHAPGKEQHDLSKIAVDWRGGGHKGACGFRTSLSTLCDILTDHYHREDGLWTDSSDRVSGDE